VGTARSAASPSSSGSGSSSALYRTIDGVEYDRALLDRATNLAKAGGGTLAGDAAQELVDAAQDGDEVEARTLGLIAKTYKTTTPAGRTLERAAGSETPSAARQSKRSIAAAEEPATRAAPAARGKRSRGSPSAAASRDLASDFDAAAATSRDLGLGDDFDSAAGGSSSRDVFMSGAAAGSNRLGLPAEQEGGDEGSRSTYMAAAAASATMLLGAGMAMAGMGASGGGGPVAAAASKALGSSGPAGVCGFLCGFCPRALLRA